jgi:hypothetical protein
LATSISSRGRNREPRCARPLPSAQYCCHQSVESVRSSRRNDNREGSKYPAGPRLARPWNAVDAEKGQARLVIRLESHCPLSITRRVPSARTFFEPRQHEFALDSLSEPQPRTDGIRGDLFCPVCALQTSSADAVAVRSSVTTLGGRPDAGLFVAARTEGIVIALLEGALNGEPKCASAR